ncbi:MAG: CBS domain-containing protein [Desulfovibrio sp.]
MEKATVKDFMIPADQYVSVNEDASLHDVIQALEVSREGNGKTTHRDVLVKDAAGKFIGKINMVDMFRALEPNYKALEQDTNPSDTLNRAYVAKVFKEFGLWGESLDSLCSRSTEINAVDIMHTPEEIELVSVDDSISKAVHSFIMGVHQPILVTEGDEVVGIVRFADVFELVRSRITACSL